MPYEQQITRQNPALFVFLLDQSLSMEMPLGGGDSRKADELALVINKILREMCIRAAGDSGVQDWFDFSVIGYSTDPEGNPIIGPALIGPLAGREKVSCSELDANPARIDTVNEVGIDEETGELVTTEVKMPIWVDPVMRNGTPMCQAIVKACEIIDSWTAAHQKSFPPIVINITDGEPGDGDPIPYADVLKQRGTEDGNVLFFNCCLSETPGKTFIFRGSSELMPNDFAKQLFHMSSVLPEQLAQVARSEGIDVEPNARAMAFNADIVVLIRFLKMGTLSVVDSLR
jgi:hypothetical protein